METYIVPLRDVITWMLVSKTMDQGSSLMQPFSKDRVFHMWNHQFDKKATVWQGHTSPIWLISYQLLCQKFLLSENLIQVVDYAFNACFKNITRCCFAILHIFSDFDKHGILFFKTRFCECSFSLPSTVNLKQHCWFTVATYGRGILQKAFINSSATRSLRHYIPCWSAERMKKERNFANFAYKNSILFQWHAIHLNFNCTMAHAELFSLPLILTSQGYLLWNCWWDDSHLVDDSNWKCEQQSLWNGWSLFAWVLNSANNQERYQLRLDCHDGR